MDWRSLCVLSGARVPDASVIALGAVYPAKTKDCEYAVYAGIPVKKS
jgi:carbonic anhydrase/acetyltransferase-like protein (isoleucine patch superfamily)